MQYKVITSLEPTYEGLKQSEGIVSLHPKSISLEPTYEGLKLAFEEGDPSRPWEFGAYL